MNINQKYFPLIIAAAIGLLALGIYVFSGRGTYDTGVRELNRQPQIESIDASNSKKIKITCKSGENYEITFKEGQQNFQDAIFNACGAEGTQETPVL